MSGSSTGQRAVSAPARRRCTIWPRCGATASSTPYAREQARRPGPGGDHDALGLDQLAAEAHAHNALAMANEFGRPVDEARLMLYRGAAAAPRRAGVHRHGRRPRPTGRAGRDARAETGLAHPSATGAQCGPLPVHRRRGRAPGARAHRGRAARPERKGRPPERSPDRFRHPRPTGPRVGCSSARPRRAARSSPRPRSSTPRGRRYRLLQPWRGPSSARSISVTSKPARAR